MIKLVNLRMKKMKSFFPKVPFIFALFSLCSCSQNPIDASYAYLKKHGQCPKDYVISRFEQYDYVFLGEYHRFKQDVDFVASLIPDLYKKGVRNLAYEFYAEELQTVLDSILTDKEWNETLFYHTMALGFGVLWGYTEYLDIFKKAWEFNQTLEPNQPKFRIVFVGSDWDPCREDGRVITKGEDFWAEIFEKEIVSKQEKALVFCGKHHAFTRYHQPFYDFEKDTLIRLNNERFGNYIYEKYPEKTFNIVFHAPWTSNNGWDEPSVKPVNGVIDSVMEMLGNKPMGFDVRGTVMGQLRADDTYYAFGYENFKLENFCDGYIFLAPYRDIVFVSTNPNFYDDHNLKRFRKIAKCMNMPEEVVSAPKEIIMEMITECPDVHFGHLRK